VIRFPQDKIVPRTVDDFLLGERLTIMQGRNVGPTELFRLLNAAGLKAVLVGAHAVNPVPANLVQHSTSTLLLSDRRKSLSYFGAHFLSCTWKIIQS
jgi:hypothetical protein